MFQVTIVVNFDLPVDVNGKADCETYLHRIGRTGRFGKVWGSSDHPVLIILLPSTDWPSTWWTGPSPWPS